MELLIAGPIEWLLKTDCPLSRLCRHYLTSSGNIKLRRITEIPAEEDCEIGNDGVNDNEANNEDTSFFINDGNKMKSHEENEGTDCEHKTMRSGVKWFVDEFYWIKKRTEHN